jgi:hypothetical protein
MSWNTTSAEYGERGARWFWDAKFALDPERTILSRLIAGDKAIAHGDNASRTARDGRIVCDQQYGLRAFPIEPFQLIDDFGTGAGIEVARRFIRQNDIRLIDQRAGDGDTLLLPAGQLIG